MLIWSGLSDIIFRIIGTAQEKGCCVMEISVRYVRDHVEVYSPRGEFLFSADNLAEAYALLED